MPRNADVGSLGKITTLPSGCRKNFTRSPGFRCKNSRIVFGIVACPLMLSADSTCLLYFSIKVIPCGAHKVNLVGWLTGSPSFAQFVKGGRLRTLMRANNERLAPPQVVADYFHNSSHNDPRSLPTNHHPGTSSSRRPFSRKQPTEAKTARNSLSWNILQGTSLFSIFCSATLPVTSRKQGICVQSTGGGTPLLTGLTP